jgi:4-azaleucine resistance transporter AzlC
VPQDATYRDGIRAGMPLVLPTVALGVSFGVLAEPVLGAFPAVAMSVLVFAGGAQFAALSVLAAGGSAAAAVAAGLLMNARFLPMGFAVGPATRGGPVARAVQGQAVIDASFVMANRGDGTFDRRLLIGATLPQALSWMSGTALGVLAGDVVGDPQAWGLDAVFPAFYLVLLVEELRNGPARVAAGLGVLVTVSLMPFAPPGVAVVAATVASLVGLRRGRARTVVEGNDR